MAQLTSLLARPCFRRARNADEIFDGRARLVGLPLGAWSVTHLHRGARLDQVVSSEAEEPAH
jgi:hypothetical protein